MTNEKFLGINELLNFIQIGWRCIITLIYAHWALCFDSEIKLNDKLNAAAEKRIIKSPLKHITINNGMVQWLMCNIFTQTIAGSIPC